LFKSWSKVRIKPQLFFLNTIRGEESYGVLWEKEEVGYEIAKKELGHNSLKSPEELKKILGWSSYLKIFLLKVFDVYFNLR
jgi:hypothetical protein